MSELRPAIVGVGNVLMGDDGVGPAAIEALRRRGLGERADLIDAGLAFSEVLCDLDARQPLAIIDAVRGPGPAGSVYRLGLDDLADGGPTSGAVSLHETGVLPALQLEALAGREFTDVTLFGVEPARIAWTQELSAPVAGAVEELVRTLCEYLDDCAASPRRRASLCASARLAARGSENS